jgi:hypothetical protein
VLGDKIFPSTSLFFSSLLFFSFFTGKKERNWKNERREFEEEDALIQNTCWSSFQAVGSEVVEVL